MEEDRTAPGNVRASAASATGGLAGSADASVHRRFLLRKRTNTTNIIDDPRLALFLPRPLQLRGGFLAASGAVCAGRRTG